MDSSPPPDSPESESPPPPPPSSPPPTPSPPPASPPPPSKSPPPMQPSPPPPPPSPSKDNGSNNVSKSPPPPPPSPTPPPSSPSNDAYSPPPPHSLKPSPPKGSSSSLSSSHPSKTTPNSNSDGDQVLPIAIGVAVGLGLLILIALLACICTCRKKKKAAPQDHHFYPSHYNPSSKGGYYSSPHHNQVNMAPQSGGWHMPMQAPPPPPQMGLSSSEMSSNYSGPQGPPLPPPHPSLALGFTKNTFSYEELAHATSGFSPANLLGQGGFGYVHKGYLPNGKEIAVKSLKAGSGQGDREFQAEVEIISRVHHRHLVSLVGYCIAGGQKLLVYEFVPNYTLDHHLHGKGVPVMEWSKRMKIALGAAKGFAYLHEDCHPKIIHRDIKGANILLDYNFEAKVADFGLAKLSNDTNTHVSTRVMGTFGYLAPEYAASGKLTDKSDVFSFGIMLLELITGRRPVDQNYDIDDSLVDWARPLCEKAFEEGDYSKLADPMLEGNYDPQEMARMVACASSSVRHSARRRPKMSQVVRALEGDLPVEYIKEGSQSAMFGSVDYETSPYTFNLKHLRANANSGSNEYSSSDFGQTN